MTIAAEAREAAKRRGMLHFDKQDELSSFAVSNDGKGIETTYVSTLTAMAVSGRMNNILLRPIMIS